jgi:hypothetical protein
MDLPSAGAERHGRRPEARSVTGSALDRPIVVVLLTGLLCAAHITGLVPRVIGLFHDDGVYTVLAKAVAEGKGYRAISLPTEPVQAKYPFVYPLMLSGVWRLFPSFPDNVIVFKILNVVALFAMLLLAARLFREHVGPDPRAKLLFVVAVGTNFLIVTFTRLVLSEILFLTLVMAALVLLTREDDPPVLVLAALAAAAYLTRSAGVAVIATAVLELARRRAPRRALWFLGLTVVLVVPWLVWQRVYGSAPAHALLRYYVSYDVGSPAYVGLLTSPDRALQMLYANVRYVGETLDTALVPPVGWWLRPVIYGFLAIGAITLCTNRRAPLAIFTALYLLLVVGWPWHPARFMTTVMPIASLCLFRGGWYVEVRAADVLRPRFVVLARWGIRAVIAIVVMFQIAWFSFYLAKRVTPPFGAVERPEQWRGFEETATWVRENTEHDAVLASGFDPFYYLYTGRHAVRPWLHRAETYFYPYGREATDLGPIDEIVPELARLGVGYLIIDPLEDYVERKAAGPLFDAILATAAGATPEPAFTSSDGLHRVYRLSRLPRLPTDAPSSRAQFFTIGPPRD